MATLTGADGKSVINGRAHTTVGARLPAMGPAQATQNHLAHRSNTANDTGVFGTAVFSGAGES
jgi:hypothetical protein